MSRVLETNRARGSRRRYALARAALAASALVATSAWTVTQTTASAAAQTIAPVTWGTPTAGGRTLVLYDDSSGDTFGWLGELNAIGDGNLATHFGLVTAEPVSEYTAGQMNSYTAVIYSGTTFDEALPAAFVEDVLSGSKPVLWVGDNVWELDNQGTSGANAGAISEAAFSAQYGWDPQTTYLDVNPTTGVTDNIATVSYEGRTFTRNATGDGPIYAPNITNPNLVSILAQAHCSDPSTGLPTQCSPLTQSYGGDSFPWAIHSRNIIYVGESPMANITENDRYMIFTDLMFDLLEPNAPVVHDALIRLEDLTPEMSAAELDQFTNFLYSQGVPFSAAVIPDYVDADGFYAGGVPVNIPLTSAPASYIAALKYMQSHGGTLIDHGLTHQYSDVANPYTAVSEDFEFYLAQCSTTAPPTLTVDPGYANSTPATLAAGESPCPNSDWVEPETPVPGDSVTWAKDRAEAGHSLFVKAGLGAPEIWTTPNYTASAADYTGIGDVYPIRYERESFYSGQLTGGPVNPSFETGHVLEQYFPYVVHDIYGETIIPEDLGDYEPLEQNNNAPRSPAQLVQEASNMLAIRQGVAAFFFDPDYPLSDLEQTVLGIKALGYTFVSPLTLVAGHLTSVSNATKY